MKTISSEANPAFRRWLRVAHTARAVREEGMTLAEGVHVAQAAVAAGCAIDAVLCRRGSVQPEALDFLETLGGGRVAGDCFELAPALYDRIAPVEQGSGLMLVLPVPAAPLPVAAACDMIYLDGVQDPGNAGALIRSAAAAGVRHVLAGPGTAALWAPKVMRAGMGAHFRVGLHERVSPGQLAAVLDGPWIVAVAHDAPSLWSEPLPAGPLGWIFGAEGNGPSAQALAISSRRVCIPTSNAVESLNVAAAAAICLFERRRCAAKGS